MGLSNCPLCSGRAVFCGDVPENECEGCHYITCVECNTFFDLSSAVDADESDDLESFKLNIENRWNALLSKGENNESK